jgi:hypothetical protein
MNENNWKEQLIEVPLGHYIDLLTGKRDVEKELEWWNMRNVKSNEVEETFRNFTNE